MCTLYTYIDVYDCHDAEIAHIYKTDRQKYEETAREWTRKFGMG